MWLRLRQVALVASELAPVEQAIADILGLKACFRDPAVGEFGLHNVLFPLGNQFLEVVAPTQPGTAAGRYLERRGGDGGYMVITQCDDHAPRLKRVEDLGVRIAHQFELDNFLNMQLHPRDTGGAFFEIDQQLGEGAHERDGPWAPAGEHWAEYRSTTRVERIAAVEIQSERYLEIAERWSEIAEIALEQAQGCLILGLDGADIRFNAPVDDRGEGLAGLDIVVNDLAAIQSSLGERGIPLSGNRFELAGMRWNLVDS